MRGLEAQVLKPRFRDLDGQDLSSFFFFFFSSPAILPSSMDRVFFFFFFSTLNCHRRRTGFFFNFFSFRPKLASSTDRVFFLPLCPSEIVCHYMLHITSIRCGLFYVIQQGIFSHIYQLLDFSTYLPTYLPTRGDGFGVKEKKKGRHGQIVSDRHGHPLVLLIKRRASVRLSVCLSVRGPEPRS